MKTIMLLFTACSVVGYVLTSCNSIVTKPLANDDVANHVQRVKRGEYLVNNMESNLSSAAGLYTTSFAFNITSDVSGVGNCTEAQFIKSIHEGKTKGLDSKRALLPAMQWQNLRKLNDEDLKSIYAYLKTATPTKNIKPASVPLKDTRFKREVRKV